ncbi:MAG: HEAT repeat domain-containing protein, partial [Candidatus Brocadiia bacterium]
MKTLVFSLAVLGVIVFSSWEYAPAPCCPPPPTTTGVLRIVSGFNRVTLPSPTRTTPRPLTTAKFGSSGERPSWVTPFTCSTVRSASSAPQASGVPITRDPHPSSFGSDPITRDPHPSSFSSAPAEDYLCASYFGWEDWWCANNVYLLNVQPAADKAYVSTLDASKDVPDLLALSCYRGNFEKGIQEIAFGALRDLGDPAMDVIIGIADGRVNIGKDLKLGRFSQDEYAEAAIRALGYLGGGKTEEVLIRILKDKSMNKRFWACGALGRLGNPANIPALENSLATDSDKFVRAAAAEAIARIGGASAIASLRRGVDPNKDCYQARAYITASQGVLAAADPVEVIRIAAASEEGNIRAAAAIGLACVIRRRLDLGHDCTELVALYTANLDNKKDADVRVTMAIASLLIGIRPTLHELFRKYLTDDRDPGIRAAFALAYALSGDIASLPYLTALPVDSDPMVETARGYALACLTTPDRAKVLKDLVASPSPVLAACGLVMLAKTSDGRDAIAALRRSTQVVVRRMVAFYLVQIPPAGGDEDIMSRISASDRAAKVVALVALGLPGDAAAVSAL